ncbi:AAA family ATPase [Tumebacillus permanentifrigoris]|uniref:HD domain-containing protein n=1 Tax=Tumebacillus permanentifrigoris TaxID=378543 RepID=A0A316DBB7_9BACL|nr:AAA family ATPase [Tumebacillus permanentifrigoris]PWK14876.1 hypothetical protein C7459_10476 [Tumebacillus permanentifrigoris]
MSMLTLCIGFPTQSKTALAQQRANASDALLVRADDELIPRECTEALQAGRPVVVDAPHRLPKHRKLYLDLARRHNYRTEALFWNVSLEQAIPDSTLSKRALQKYQRHLQVPTTVEDFDHFEVLTTEPVQAAAQAFFQEQEGRLINNPTELIRDLEREGSLQAWLPELHAAIPVDQHNPHHRFTVYEHIMKATAVIGGTSLKYVWTMLLHDIGKAYPGIKQFTGSFKQDHGKWRKKDFVLIENGADIREGRDSGDFYVVQGAKVPRELINSDLNGHFYQHENIGAQMAFRVLTRLGYPHDFAREVMTLVQFHMLLPYETETADLGELRKFYERVGPYAADLLLVRLADSRGK